ncbi:peptidase [Chlorella sorokiniana]|uniref:Peptidase n=1 Tax=Chlorella sorokiniana TaxID=3076 RepID=A0A2P6U4R1_CHLSO|nr:peptidase [Chlorella sorokiniana]|eukprot:PRW61296.1 peptidase [Chlorella sorokiniana]
MCAPRLNVYAVEDGVICKACGFGWDPAWGYRLTLNAATNQFFYTHLGYIDVKAGGYVRRGQFLGNIGDFSNGPTTNHFPPHLHFATRDGNALTYVRSCSRS